MKTLYGMAALALAAQGCGGSSDTPIVQNTNGVANNTGFSAGVSGAGVNANTGGSGSQAGTTGMLPVGTTGGATTTTTGGQAQTSGMNDPQTELWCNAKAVIEENCQLCHGAEPFYGAPMSLVTYQDMLAAAGDGRPVHEVIGERLHDTNRPMPPLDQEPLEPAELEAIDAWVNAGAPGDDGAACNTGGALGDGGVAMGDGGATGEVKWPEECEEFYELRAPKTLVRAQEERFEDVSVPVPWDGQVYALAMRPIANNKRVVHHWILYDGSRSMVTSWSPGKEFETFPEGVGVYMPTSGNFTFNMHYYNKFDGAQDEEDSSGVEICVTRQQVEHVATTNMFGTLAFTVPSGRRHEVVDEYTVSSNEEVHLITSSPHMHATGVHAKFEVIRQDGTVEVLHDTPFNWENQTIKPIDVVLHEGDTVKTTCIYENNSGQPKRFGSSSEDEMCFNFARYYPRGALSAFGLGGGLFGN